MFATDRQTGYPSVDRPWLKYYDDIDVTRSLFHGSLADFVIEKNKEYPQDIAFTYYGNKITYGTFLNEINKCAKIFIDLGVTRKSVVTVISVATPELLYLIYAANSLGATINMVDPRNSEEHITEYIDSTSSEIVIVLDAILPGVFRAIANSISSKMIIVLSTNESMSNITKLLYKLACKKIDKEVAALKLSRQVVTYKSLTSAQPIELNVHDSELENATFIFYTGGSTGTPKGVLLTDDQINSLPQQYGEKIHWFNRQEKWLAVTACFFAYSWVVSFHMPLVMGMNCCFEMYDPQKICKNIIKNKYNHIALNPGILEHFLNFKHVSDLSFLIAPICGGESLSLTMEKKLNDFFSQRKANWKICQGYGMTETSSGIIINYNNEINKPGSVGIPFSHTLVSAFDSETSEELACGEIGEICISGPSVMSGYYRNPKETEQCIRIHSDGRRWLHSGDLGYVDEDGFVFIVGRIKRMIVGKGGWKIYPQQVEETLEGINDIEGVACVPVHNPDDDTDTKCGVFVIKKADSSKTNTQVEAEMRDYAATKLTEYMRPVMYVFVNEFPRTSVGKIDYRKLETMI